MIVTYATFSTPMARRALQLSIISAQHFCTRSATSMKGFSCCAALEPSRGYQQIASAKVREKITDDSQPVAISMSVEFIPGLLDDILKPQIQINLHLVHKV